MMLTSSVLSDGVLALVSGGGALLLWRGGRRGSALALAVVAAAALLGVLHFGGVAGTAVWHDRLSRFAAIAAVPAFCWAFWRSLAARRAPGWLVVALAMALLYLIARFVHWPPYPTAIGAVGLLLALWGALAARSARVTVPGALAVALYALAGLVVGTHGSWHGWLRVDLYHYLLAAANALFVLALRAGGAARK